MEQDDKLKKIFDVLRSNKETRGEFQGMKYGDFREVILSNREAQDALHSDLVKFDLISTPDSEEYWQKVGIRKAKQVASQPSAAPPQPPSLLDITREQIRTPMAPEPQFQPFVQFKNEKELQQSARSPVFLDNAAASGVLADREQIREVNPLTWRQDQETGKYGVFEKDAPLESKPLATFDTMNEAAAAIKSRNAADNGLIMPFKEAEESFGKMTPEQQQAAIEGSSGAQLANQAKESKTPLWQKVKQVASDVASGFNRAVAKTPSGIAKTVSEIGTGIANTLGGKSKVEDDYLYQLADKYDKWIDDSDFAKQWIGDKNVNSLAGDVGSGFGQVATMIASGGGSAANALKANPTLLKRLGEEIFNPASGLAFTQIFNSEYEGMKAQGEDDNTAFYQALTNAVAGAPLERLPLANLAERMEKAVGAPIAKRLLNAFIQGGEEMTQEGAQQLLSNLTNNQLVELESNVKKWNEGLERSADAGGIVGTLLGLIAGAKGGKVRGKQPPTQLGGIPTQPVPDNTPPFKPEGPTTYEPVTEEEFTAWQEGNRNPERMAGVEEDADRLVADSKYQLPDDPLYQQMVVQRAMEKEEENNQQANTKQQPQQQTKEEIKIEPIPIEVGQFAVINGEKGEVKQEENGQFVLETPTTIYELDDRGLSGIGAKLLSPKQDTKPQYEIEVVSDDVALVDGVEHEIIKDSKGNTIALKGPEKTIRTEPAMVDVDIKRNKIETQETPEQQVEIVQQLLPEATPDKQGFVDQIIGQNMTERVATLLDQGLTENTTEQDLLQLKLWADATIADLLARQKGNPYAQEAIEAIQETLNVVYYEYYSKGGKFTSEGGGQSQTSDNSKSESKRRKSKSAKQEPVANENQPEGNNGPEPVVSVEPTGNAVQPEASVEKGAEVSGAVQPAVAGGTDTGVEGVGRGNDVGEVIIPKLSATTTDPNVKGVPVMQPQGFAPALRKLGYTDEEIGKMTFEQQQEIAINKTEPARAESSAKLPQPTPQTGKGEGEVERFNNKNLTSKEGNINTGKLQLAENIPNVEKVIGGDSDGREIKVKINGDKLKGTLLSRNGTFLFRAMQGRYFTLAKVGDFYLPFYISSAGTSGKNQGEWYPFFGYNNWLVKGYVGKHGEMEYSDKISKVQKLLNENFIIPAKYLQADNKVAIGEQFIAARDKDGKIIREGKYNFEKMIPNENRKVLFDLDEYIKTETHHHQEQRGETTLNEHDWVAEKTGLNPEGVINDGGGSADSWIKGITNLIDDAEKHSKGIIKSQPTPQTGDDVRESVKSEPAKPTPPTPKTYAEAVEKLTEEAGLTEEEVKDYLPIYLQTQVGMKGDKDVKRAWGILLSSDPNDLVIDEDTNEGAMSKKIADWVRGEQSKSGWLDRQIAATDDIINDLKSSATSGPAIYFYQAYKAVLEAAKAIGEKITNSEARKRARQMVIDAGQATAAELDKFLKLVEKTPTIRKHKPIVNALKKALEEGTAKGIQDATNILKTGLADLKADLTPKQINALLDRLAKMKKPTSGAIDRFLDYAAKVVDDANYILQERAANTLRNRVEKMSNSASQTAINRALYKAYSGLRVAEMEGIDLQKFIDFGNKIVAGNLTKADRLALEEFIVSQQQVQSDIAQARAEKSAKRLEKNQREEYDRLKKEGQLPDGVDDFESYLAYLSEKPGTEKQVAAATKRLAEFEIPDEASESDKAIITGLRSQNLSVLSVADLALLENGLSTFEDTGRIFGLGDLLAKAKAWNSVNSLVEQGIKTRKLVDYKDAVKNSVTLIFNRFFNTRLDAAKVRSTLIQPWLSASTNAYVQFENARARVLIAAKKLGLKEANWDRLDLFGFLNEAGTNQQAFEQLKAQKLSDIETMKDFLEENKNKEESTQIKIVKSQYDALSKAASELSLESAKNIDEIKSKLTDKEKEFYFNTLRPELDAITPKLIERIEQYGNKVVNVIQNYWPRNAKKKVEKVVPMGELEGLSFYEPNKVGQNVFGREKGRVALLGKNGWYESKGQLNFFNGLREAIMIAEAVPEYHMISAILNSDKGFAKLFGQGSKDLRDYFVSIVNETKNHGRYNVDTRTFIKKASDRFANIATGGLVQTPVQIVKQPTAIAYPMVVAPRATTKAIEIVSRLLKDKTLGNETALREAFKMLELNSTLGLRAALPEVISLNEYYSADMGIVEATLKRAIETAQLPGKKSLEYGDKFTSAVAMLAGYINHQIESGKLKNAADFDLIAEFKKGFSMDAIAAGEQMQGEANNENSRILFSKQQKDSPGMYFLTNFTRQAVMGFRYNLAKAFDTNLPTAARLEATASLGAYLAMATAFQAASRAVASSIADIYRWFDDDDDEDELKAYDEAKSLSKRDAAIIQEALNLGVGHLDIVYQMAANIAAFGAFKAWKSWASKEDNKEKIEDLDIEAITKRTLPEYNPIYSNDVPGLPGVVAKEGLSFLEAMTSGDEKEMKQGGGLALLLLTGLTVPKWAIEKARSEERKKEKARKYYEKSLE